MMHHAPRAALDAPRHLPQAHVVVEIAPVEHRPSLGIEIVGGSFTWGKPKEREDKKKPGDNAPVGAGRVAKEHADAVETAAMGFDQAKDNLMQARHHAVTAPSPPRHRPGTTISPDYLPLISPSSPLSPP